MVLVLVEHSEGRPDDLSLQALTLARAFAAGAPVHAVLAGPGGREAAAGLASQGVATAHVAEHPGLDAFAPEAWAAILEGLAEAGSATAVIAAGSDRGNEVMARLGARSGLPLAANCIAASPGPPVELTRIRWGGSLLEESRLHSPRALLTTAPHAFPIEDAAAAAPPAVELFTPLIEDQDLLVKVVDRVGASGGGISLADARVVVSGGRGLGSAEKFAIVDELAGLLGAAVGCSRAVTMAGWRPHTQQVGQTGTKIAPDLYVACGISGATQHMAGTKGAKKILAINSDAEAPIMSLADYSVVGDVHEVVPAISAELRRRRGA